MKKYFAALCTTALIGVAPYALAASSTDLTVKGLITPTGCTPMLSDGGAIDVGKVSVKDLSPTQYTRVSSQPMQLTVTCEAPTPFALYGIDNKPSTSAADSYFGLGLTSSDEKIGYLQPRIITTLADGQPVHAIGSADNGETWKRAYNLLPERLTSTGAVGTLIPIYVKELSMNLMIDTRISPANSLTLTDDVPIDGSATFEMTYL